MGMENQHAQIPVAVPPTSAALSLFCRGGIYPERLGRRAFLAGWGGVGGATFDQHKLVLPFLIVGVL